MKKKRPSLWHTELRLSRSAMRGRDHPTLRLPRLGALLFRAGRFPIHLSCTTGRGRQFIPRLTCTHIGMLAANWKGARLVNGVRLGSITFYRPR
jgi:hypothetical protein